MRYASALALAVVMLALHPAPATASDELFTPANAATWYNRALDSYDRLSEEHWDALAAYDADPSRPPPESIRRLVQRGRRIINLVQRGAQQDYADFGLNYSQGWEMLLPHLGRLRAAARLMRADVIIRLHEGDTTGAAKELAAMYRLAEHLSADRTIISSLVGLAIFDLTDDVVQAGFDQAAFDPADSAGLLRSVRRLDRPDPFQMTEAVAMEQEVIVDWVHQRFQAAESDAQILNQLNLLSGADLDPEELSGTLGEDFDAHLAQYDEAMTMTVEAFADPDREAGRARLEELAAEVIAGEHGILAKVMMPAMTRIFDRVVESRQLVERRIEMLEGIVTGEIDPRRELNAAYLYVQAVEKITALDAARLRSLRAFDADPGSAPGPGLDTLLEEAEPILALLEEASRLTRCDFSFARQDRTPRIVPRYVAGLRDAFRLLHADALQRLRAAETDAGLARLETMYRMIVHIGGDGTAGAALVAHRAFQHASALTTDLSGAGLLADTQRAALESAAGRIGRKDPFGYTAGIVEFRTTVAARFRGRLPKDEQERQRLNEATEAAGRLDGDQALYLVVILETMTRAGRSETDGAEPAPAALQALDDVLALKALGAARRDVPRVAPLLAAASVDVFAGRDVRAIAQIERRRQQARRDLRAGLRLLAPPAGEVGTSPPPPSP